MRSMVAVRRLLGVRKPSSPIRLPGGSSMLNSLTRNFPLTVRNISLAASPFLNNLSPLRYLRSVMNGLSHSIDVSPCVRLFDEVEHLTKAKAIDGDQQQIQQKGRHVPRKRAKGGKECTADHVRNPEPHDGLRQQRSDEEDGANQGKHVG